MNSNNQGTNSKLTQNNLGKLEATCEEEKYGTFKSQQRAKKWIKIILWFVFIWFFLWLLGTAGELKRRLEIIENKMELLSERIDKDGKFLSKEAQAALQKEGEAIKQDVISVLQSESAIIRKDIADAKQNAKQKIVEQDVENKAKNKEEEATKQEASGTKNTQNSIEELMSRLMNERDKDMLENAKPRRNPDGTYNCGGFTHESLSWCKAVQRGTEAYVRDSSVLVNRHFKETAAINDLAEKEGILTAEEFDKAFNAITGAVKAGQKAIDEKIVIGRAEIVREQDKLEKTVKEEIEKGRLLVQGGVTKSLTQQLGNIGNSLDADLRKETADKTKKQ